MTVVPISRLGPASGLPLPVALVGPMGAGKTLVGRALAGTLDIPFIDTDARIVTEHGPIPEIFAEHGEPVFRDWERRTVLAALDEPAVVALGGGAVLDPDVRMRLCAITVIWLQVSEAAVEPRLRGGGRPLLHDDSLVEWTRIKDAREPHYREVATVIVDTSDAESLTEIVRAIRRELEGTV